MSLSRTKTYYRQGERRNRWGGKGLIALALTAFFLVILVTPLRVPVSQGVATIIAPLWSTQNSIGQTMHSYGYLFVSKKALWDENVRLKANLSSLALEGLSANVVREENNRLKEALGRPGVSDMLLANILIRPNRTPYDVLVIDIGSDVGLSIGDTVFTDGDFAIGKVVEVSRQSAKVALFSSPQSEIRVLVGDAHVEATAYGLGGGNFQIALARGIDVKSGDVISAPDLGISVLGILESIRMNPTSPTQILLFKLPVNFQTLDWVLVRVDGQSVGM